MHDRLSRRCFYEFDPRAQPDYRRSPDEGGSEDRRGRGLDCRRPYNLSRQPPALSAAFRRSFSCIHRWRLALAGLGLTVPGDEVELHCPITCRRKPAEGKAGARQSPVRETSHTEPIDLIFTIWRKYYFLTIRSDSTCPATNFAGVGHRSHNSVQCRRVI